MFKIDNLAGVIHLTNSMSVAILHILGCIWQLFETYVQQSKLGSTCKYIKQHLTKLYSQSVRLNWKSCPGRFNLQLGEIQRYARLKTFVESPKYNYNIIHYIWLYYIVIQNIQPPVGRNTEICSTKKFCGESKLWLQYNILCMIVFYCNTEYSTSGCAKYRDMLD